MATAKKAPAKKAAPRKAPARKTAASASPAENYDEALYAAATQLALDYLYKEAFKYGRRAHASRLVEDSSIPREVKVVLQGVIERNES